MKGNLVDPSFVTVLSFPGRPVPVYSHGNDEHVLMATASRLFVKGWKDLLDPRFEVHQITFQAVDFKGPPSPDKILFLRFKVKTQKSFEEIVELRGGTVVLFPVFTCEGIRYTVLTKQARIATGKYELVESPAGMVENGTFRGAAANEFEQELDMVFADEELVDLTASLPGEGDGIYFSPGLLDEWARFYAVERDLTREQLSEIQGKATGLLEEGEQITLWVVPLDEVPSCTRDGKTFIALYLYNQYSQKRGNA